MKKEKLGKLRWIERKNKRKLFGRIFIGVKLLVFVSFLVQSGAPVLARVSFGGAGHSHSHSHHGRGRGYFFGIIALVLLVYIVYVNYRESKKSLKPKHLKLDHPLPEKLKQAIAAVAKLNPNDSRSSVREKEVYLVDSAENLYAIGGKNRKIFLPAAWVDDEQRTQQEMGIAVLLGIGVRYAYELRSYDIENRGGVITKIIPLSYALSYTPNPKLIGEVVRSLAGYGAYPMIYSHEDVILQLMYLDEKAGIKVSDPEVWKKTFSFFGKKKEGIPSDEEIEAYLEKDFRKYQR